jgi:hypothetical protein
MTGTATVGRRRDDREPGSPPVVGPELADQLLARLLGPDGLLSQVTRAVLERALGEERTAHLGYEKHDPAGRGSGNSRNGTTPRTGTVRKITLSLCRSVGGDGAWCQLEQDPVAEEIESARVTVQQLLAEIRERGLPRQHEPALRLHHPGPRRGRPAAPVTPARHPALAAPAARPARSATGPAPAPGAPARPPPPPQHLAPAPFSSQSRHPVWSSSRHLSCQTIKARPDQGRNTFSEIDPS